MNLADIPIVFQAAIGTALVWAAAAIIRAVGRLVVELP